MPWEDETFIVGDIVRRGRACRWKASELLMGMLDWERARAETGTVSATDEKEREEASLAGTDIQRTVELQIRQPDGAVIRPVQIEDKCCWRLNPGEIARYVMPIDVAVGLAA